MVEPIDDLQCREVREATQRYVAHARRRLDHHFEDIDVRFDLKGRSAGMYRVQRGQRWIRYNPYLFAKYYRENLDATVPHEVAHYLTDCVFGYANVKPHGREWRSMMAVLEAEPTVHCHFDLSGIPTRQYRRFPYVCRCRHHEMTSIRHNRVQHKGVRYFCRFCRTELVYAPAPSIADIA